MLKKFHPIPFILGLIIGLFLVCFFPPRHESITKYPTPASNDVYRDKNGICFTFHSKEVDCDKNEGTLREFPLQ